MSVIQTHEYQILLHLIRKQSKFIAKIKTIIQKKVWKV
jgi:hypothetical protein